MLDKQDYLLEKNLLEKIKKKIQAARQQAVYAVNKELLFLYWDIGKTVIEEQKSKAWGSKVIERLSRELKKDFPDMKGFSPRNLKYMRKFALLFLDFSIVQTVFAQLSWSHNIALMEKVKEEDVRLWYAQKCIEYGWSLNTLIHQIKGKLYERQALTGKTTNFERRLPKPQSELAMEVLKDPYIFDFISMSQEMIEKDIEKQIVSHITKFLLELGAGFAFIGNQYHIEIGNQDFYIDLLFYHTRLHCFVAIELKNGPFKPEYAGKINFYLSALDDIVKGPLDNPSIGIILCRDKNNVIAEYALRDMTKPIGISEYKMVNAIPSDLKSSLPTIKQLENELKSIEDTK